jgi:hypothetical protein
MSEEKDGVYCKVCGGIIPQDASIGTIEVDGKPTGISGLEFILDEVISLDLQNETDTRRELVKRAQALNYIPGKMIGKYSAALYHAYLERLNSRER